jgi:hypothetical protein
MKTWALLGVLLVTVLAGCFGDDTAEGPAGDDGPDWPSYERPVMPEDPMPEGAGHVHADASQHKFLWNYDFSDRDPLLQNAANTAGVHALDVQAGHLFAAVYGSHTVAIDGGLVIWDLSDPAHPDQVGRWTIPGSVGGDRSVEATPDGDYAVISTEPVDCAGHVNPSGVISAYLVDTSDKSLPIAVDVVTVQGTASDPTQPGGLSVHSVAVHRIGESDYAFLSGAIYRIDRAEGGGSLVHVGDIPVGHDMYVRDTPWNTTWAIVANGGGGMVVWDVTDPASPFEIANWNIEGRGEGEVPDYYFHTADVAFLGDQILFALSSEDWGETISPLWILDGNPLWGLTGMPGQASPFLLQELGRWQNPGNHSALPGLTFSLHNPRFHDGGILTLSSYHGGMWQLDIRIPEFWADPAPIGYAVYTDGTPSLMGDPIENAVSQNLCGLDIQAEAPSYWDVEVGPNGHLYLADAFMGLYTFAPADSHPVYGANRTVEYPGTAGT